jgi:hypothetical protein
MILYAHSLQAKRRRTGIMREWKLQMYMNSRDRTMFLSTLFSRTAAAHTPGAALYDWQWQNQVQMPLIIRIIINMLVPVQLNSFTHLRVLLVLTDRGILAQSN